MTQPLRIKEDFLNGHFAKVAGILQTQVEGRIEFSPEQIVSSVVAALKGEGCEQTRERGRDVLVAPIKCLGGNLCAWLRYREKWDHDSEAKGSMKKFIFQSASMAIHFGLRDDIYKPQMFRLEWAGWANWNGTNFGYQAKDAGHPHWQFDALESLSEADTQKRADELKKKLADDEDKDVREFSSQQLTDGVNVRDMIFRREFSRIHFASAAAWWKNPPCCNHAHSPGKVQDLQVWLSKSLSYLSSELDRI